ncbi:MAG: hypothetical protein JSW20_11780 [Nitrospiraceae bacterium]|nr:MAG: hypothetical protein JSW20_11780 [Nitrospiraceae bacterium]
MQQIYWLLKFSLTTVISFIFLVSCGGAGLINSDNLTNDSPDSNSSCPEVSGPEVMGSVSSDLIDEASGLVASRTNSGVLWTHNDSGDQPRIFAMNLKGDHLGEFNLLNTENHDWEDIAAGPGPADGEQYLYIGDIGDNSRIRTSIFVYRLREPEVEQTQPPVSMDITDVDVLEMQYPDNQAFDAETLLVDPVSGDIFIVTKNNTATSKVFRNPSPHNADEIFTLEEVATVKLGTSFLYAVTGGDVSGDGSMIILRSYLNAVILFRDDAEDMAHSFTGVSCGVPVDESLGQQGEAITFDPDGSGYTTVIEGLHPSLTHYSINN